MYNDIFFSLIDISYQNKFKILFIWALFQDFDTFFYQNDTWTRETTSFTGMTK